MGNHRHAAEIACLLLKVSQMEQQPALRDVGAHRCDAALKSFASAAMSDTPSILLMSLSQSTAD